MLVFKRGVKLLARTVIRVGEVNGTWLRACASGSGRRTINLGNRNRIGLESIEMGSSAVTVLCSAGFQG